MDLSIVRILSDQFAAWHYDAKVQSGLESSYQAYEYVKSLLRALENENVLLQLWNINLLLIPSFSAKKRHYAGSMRDMSRNARFGERENVKEMA